MRVAKLVLSGVTSVSGVVLAQTTGTGPDFSNITVDLSPVWGLAGTIVGALVTMIVVRKGIKLANRS